MNSWKHDGPVVAEVDGSAAGQLAVGLAAAEALRSGAELVLASPYAITTSSTAVPAGSRYSGPYASVGLRGAVKTARQAGGPDLAIRVFTGEGPRSRVLPTVARRARLLVLPAGVGHGPRRLLTAQADLTLMSRIGTPTVVVPGDWDVTAAFGGVVVGVDGTELSSEALAFAFAAAADRRAPLTVVHAAANRRTGDEQTSVRRAERALAEALAGWAEEYPDVEVRRRPTAQSPVAALLRESHGAELLVVGAHGTKLAAVNPVVRRLVAESACPIAVLPHRVTAVDRDIAARRIQPVDDVVHPTY